MKKRIEWVDLAKGVGILLVVYGHVILGIHDADIGFSGINYDIQHSVIYTVHMPLFFFLSGLFAIRWVKRDAKVAILQKVKSLLIPYFIWGIVQGIIMSIFAGSTNGKMNITSILKLPIKPFGQFWFVYDLFWIFLIYYVATNFFKLNLKSIFVISAILSVVSPMIHFWQVGRILYYLPFFMMGIVIATLQFGINKLNTVALIVIFLLLNAAYFLLNMGLVLNSILETITAVIGIAMIINILSKFNSGWLAYIGKIPWQSI